MQEQSKVCTKCRVAQPVGAFYMDRSMADQLTKWCVGCFRVARGLPRDHEPPLPPIAAVEHLPPAYFAGFFDADGMVGISPARDSSVFLLQVRVSQVAPEVLHAFRSEFGGKLIGPKTRSGNSRPIYQWGLESQKAEKFLRVVAPYLVVKRERVAMALEFRELFKGPNILPRGREKTHPANVAKRERIVRQREDYYHRMRAANQRGLMPYRI
jgi:hypothetical protein